MEFRQSLISSVPATVTDCLLLLTSHSEYLLNEYLKKTKKWRILFACIPSYSNRMIFCLLLSTFFEFRSIQSNDFLHVKFLKDETALISCNFRQFKNQAARLSWSFKLFQYQTKQNGILHSDWICLNRKKLSFGDAYDLPVIIARTFIINLTSS